jgi:hypothetical protein
VRELWRRGRGKSPTVQLGHALVHIPRHHCTMRSSRIRLWLMAVRRTPHSPPSPVCAQTTWSERETRTCASAPRRATQRPRPSQLLHSQHLTWASRTTSQRSAAFSTARSSGCCLVSPPAEIPHPVSRASPSATRSESAARRACRNVASPACCPHHCVASEAMTPQTWACCHSAGACTWSESGQELRLEFRNENFGTVTTSGLACLHGSSESGHYPTTLDSCCGGILLRWRYLW